MGWLSEMIENVGNAAGQLVQSGVGLGEAVFQGGGLQQVGEKAAKRVNQAVGAAFTLGTGGVLESNFAQEFLENEDVSKVTLGMSQDLAGTARVATQGRYLRDINPEDLADIGRLAGKAATLGTAYVAYDYGTSSLGMNAESYIPSWLPSWTTVGYGAAGLSVGSKIASGNIDGAAKDLGVNLPPGVLPGPPSQAPPPGPLRPIAAPQPGVAEPSPWGSGGGGGGGYSMGPSAQPNVVMIATVAAAVIVGGVLLSRMGARR